MRRTSLRVVMLGLLAAFPTPAGATILLFDQMQDGSGDIVPTGSSGVLPSGYGDHVTGAAVAVPGGALTYGDGGEGFTPDVTVDIFAATGPSDPRVTLWTTGYGDLVNVLFGEGPGIGGSPTLSVLLSAAPGFVVDLYGFDLGGFSNQDYTIAGVEVFADALSVFSMPDVLVEGNATGPGHTTFAFDGALSGSEVLVRLDLSNLASNVQDNIGIDSIRFGQTPPRIVPEPTTCQAVVAMGLSCAFKRRSKISRLTGNCR